MTRQDCNTEHAAQAIFCVCADDAILSAAADAALTVSGAVFAGDFRDYITAEKRPQFPPLLKASAACVALIDFDKDPELALETAVRLQQIFARKISIAAVGSGLDADLLLRAMRAGCTEYMTKPVNVASLSDCFSRFYDRMAPTPSAPASVGKVIAVFGAKGGVGATALAVHLAIHLVRQHGKRTLLIDHKHQLGHVALYLGLKDTVYHFEELLRNADRLDMELLHGFVSQHASGLGVIASPEIAARQYERQEDIDRVIGFLRQKYDFILIDSSMGYQDTKLPILEQADEVYLVSTPDVAALRDLSRQIQYLKRNDSAAGKLRLVLNRSTSDDSLTAEQIEKAVGLPVSIVFEHNGDLLKALNEGQPISPQRRTDFNHQLTRWSNQIVHGSETADKTEGKKSLMAFWR